MFNQRNEDNNIPRFTAGNKIILIYTMYTYYYTIIIIIIITTLEHNGIFEARYQRRC